MSLHPRTAGELEPQEAPTVRSAGFFYVGVSDGEPIQTNKTDPVGDAVSMEIYATPEDALARFHNVRRVHMMIEVEPVRAPESWGAIGHDE